MCILSAIFPQGEWHFLFIKFFRRYAMRSEKIKIKDKMTEIINSIEVLEGVQIAVNSKFFNHFANSLCKSATLFDFYKSIFAEIGKFRNNIAFNTDIIEKINF